jgi:NAD(P)-dependent dehydrogenase (short-subunit alcohol dehydrogenase family)
VTGRIVTGASRDAKQIVTPNIPDSIPRAALVIGALPYGAVIARALADAGFAVAIQCDSATSDLPAAPPSTTFLPTDLSDRDQTEGLFARASDALGPIGVLVNGVAPSNHDQWDTPSRTIWDRQFEVTLRLPFVLTQQFAKALPPPREGVVINLLDQLPNPRALSHTLANAALATMTRSLALALAPSIRVNSIALGPALRVSGGPPATNGDAATPENVANTVLAILALRSMTGQMMVPGGPGPTRPGQC